MRADQFRSDDHGGRHRADERPGASLPFACLCGVICQAFGWPIAFGMSGVARMLLTVFCRSQHETQG